MLPNFLGLGANRSGSTWLYHNLRQHKDVFLPRKKELHFFDRDYEMGLAHYESEFSDWSGESAVGEITPEYFHLDGIPQYIKKDLPDIRLFVSLRNPVDRAYSNYWRLVAVGKIDGTETFDEAIQHREYLLDYGRYYRHLSRFYRYFEPGDLLVLLFDSIKSEPQTVLRELFTYLRVDPEAASSYTTERVNSSSNTQNLARSKSLWYLQRAFGRFGLNSLRFGVERFNKTKLPSMSAETRRYLESYYRDDILATQDLIQMDLSNWLNDL